METCHSSRITPITIDAHLDVPWMKQKFGIFDLAHPTTQVDFPRMRQGKLDTAIMALYLSETLQDQLGPYDAHEAIISQVQWLNTQSKCSIVGFPDSYKSIELRGEMPIFLALEGGRLLQENIELLFIFKMFGIRYLTLTHNRNTSWADSATDITYHGGLVDFGREIIQRCNELSIFVDVSHASDATADDALSCSTKSVWATHSGCRAIFNHPRNLSDNLIRKIDRSGGFIGVPFARNFVGPSASGIIDHIDHIVQIVGHPFCVGIGSDLDGAAMVDEVSSVEDWHHVVNEALSNRGYVDEDIAMIAGMNLFERLEKQYDGE